MEGSVQTEQALLEELSRLRKRVHELEQLTARQPIGLDPVSSAPTPEELEVAFETLTDAIVVYDTAGHVIRTNSAFYRLISTTTQPHYLLQTTYEQSGGSDIHDAEGQKLTPVQWPIYRILQGEVLSGENTTDITLITLDQREMRVCISGAPLRNEYGQIIGAVANFRDVTEQRKLEQRTLALLEAAQRMDEFLSIASHELRNPLTTINGNLQLAKRHLNLLSLPDNLSTDVIDRLDMVQELLSRAQHQVQIQNRLVSDLLDVSRIQANRLHLRLHSCDLVEIVRTTLEDLRAVTPLRTINLEIAEGTTAPILADGDRISQVVSNYLTNALKYSQAKLPIEVRVEVIDGTARFSVSDKGPGLGAEEQTRLWQRFYRVPGMVAQDSFSVGLGLGLYICRTIIEHHQGQVGVQSAPGQGSTFWFTLPLAP
ncbi:MAG TPA: PAS domain-containing sensor histidine kinase [Ktedonosporobacter sp.]|nr:PAS domain-containing sensor histidine kinase [Ktedonosporobacter sp.]